MNHLKASLMRRDLLGWVFLGLGIVLRLRQYLANRSFWADEASLALNITNRTFAGLTQPLDYQQGAPLGFLFLEKLAILALGNKDYILRLLPLVAGLLTLSLIHWTTKEYAGRAGPLAIFLAAISWPLIYYSSELKQYSSDAMFAVGLIYLALRCFRPDTRGRDFVILGVAGLTAIWISHPATFTLAGVGAALLVDKLMKRSRLPLFWALGLGLLWTASFGAMYLISIRSLITNEYLMSYWERGFMPMPPWEKPSWFIKSYLSFLTMISPSLDRPYLAIGFSILITAGILSLVIRNRVAAALVILPFAAASVASAIQRYPLRGRFLLFLVPLAILLIAEGWGAVYALIEKRSRSLAVLAYAFSLTFLLWIPLNGVYGKFISPPERDHIKPAMEYVAKNRLQNDVVYVFQGAQIQFAYYAPFYGLDTGKIVSSTDHLDALEAFYRDIDRLKGNNRVWILLSSTTICSGCDENTRTLCIEYLDRYGVLLDHVQAPGADAFLYDLGHTR